MKNINNQKQELDIGRITDKPTPKLDKIASDFYKILSATAAKFIPDACEALRQDWDVSLNALKNPNNKGLRDEMRERILDRFSKDREPRAIWNDDVVKHFFPDEFRNPVAVEGTKGAIESARATKATKAAKKYQEKIRTKSLIFDKLSKDLPEPPNEPEEEVVTGGWSIGPSKYQRLGGETKSPLTKMGDIRDACRKLWTTLTEKEYMPGLSEDLENDFIKPTREYRKFVYELDENEKAGLHNWLTFTEAAISDMLDILEEAKKQ